jgi:PilZ domain
LEGDPKPASDNEYIRFLADNRACPRFRLDVPIRIYPRNAAVICGTTLDLSLSGIAAMLRDHLPIGEVVRLEFALNESAVEIYALVRQHNAFRYGFQFIEAASPNDTIGRAWRQLYMEQTSYAPQPL